MYFDNLGLVPPLLNLLYELVPVVCFGDGGCAQLTCSVGRIAFTAALVIICFNITAYYYFIFP